MTTMMINFFLFILARLSATTIRYGDDSILNISPDKVLFNSIVEICASNQPNRTTTLSINKTKSFIPRSCITALSIIYHPSILRSTYTC